MARDPCRLGEPSGVALFAQPGIPVSDWIHVRNQAPLTEEMTMSDPIPTTTPAPDTDVPRFRDAYQRLIEEIRAVPNGDLIAINIDIPTAVTTALGALPEIRNLRARMAAEMPQFDIARFD